MMKTGDIPQELKDTGFDWDVRPQFFEARAMVHGNVCSNKVEGIAYGRFKFQGKAEAPAPVVPPADVEVFGVGSAGTT